MFKKLPVVNDTVIHTECWSHNKLSIIESSEFSEAWLASHIGLFMGIDYQLLFGINNQVLRMGNFSDILSFEEIYYWDVLPNEFTNLIINSIRDNKYIIVYLMTSVKKHQVHEYLFYGYDLKEQVFFISKLHRGKFCESKVTFDQATECYKNYFDFHLTYPDELVNDIANFYPITQVSLKKDYNTNLCISEALYRFQEERHGNCYIDTNHPNESQIRTGVECLTGIKERLSQFIRDQIYIKDIIFRNHSKELHMNFSKLYEHSCIILRSMKWVNSILDKNNNWSCIESYQSISSEIYSLSLLALKFRLTEDWRIIHNIYEKIDYLYTSTIDSLDSFLTSYMDARKSKNNMAYSGLLNKVPDIMDQRLHFKE